MPRSSTIADNGLDTELVPMSSSITDADLTDEEPARTTSNGATTRRDHTRPTALRMTPEVYELIRATVGRAPAETGAVLGGSRAKDLVTHVYVDRTAHQTGATYTPDDVTINRLVDEEWKPEGIDFLGFVHSHPGRSPFPSYGDLVYAKRILGAVRSLDYLVLPIVETSATAGLFHLAPYVVHRTGEGVSYRSVDLVDEHDVPIHQDERREVIMLSLKTHRREIMIVATVSILLAAWWTWIARR